MMQIKTLNQDIKENIPRSKFDQDQIEISKYSGKHIQIKSLIYILYQVCIQIKNDADQKSLDQDIKEDVSQLKFDLDPIFISDQK